MQKQAFDIGVALDRIGQTVLPWPKAALIQLADEGYTSTFEQSWPASFQSVPMTRRRCRISSRSLPIPYSRAVNSRPPTRPMACFFSSISR
jgi:hypothetical protein